MFKLDTGAPSIAPAKQGLVYSEPKILEVSSNRIYFYSEIDRGSVLTLNRNLRDMCNTHLAEAQTKGLDKPVPIRLYISSFGGGVFDGLAAMDEIVAVSKQVDVLTFVDGCSASAATFLSIFGTRRYINKHAFMLIHQLSHVMWGKYEEFKDEMVNLDKIMEVIKGLYTERTKLPLDKLEEILRHDLWFSPQECLEYGLVDEIL